MWKRRVCLALVGTPTVLLVVALWTAMASPSAVVEAQGGPQLTLVIGTTDEVTSLDPAEAYDLGSWEILYNVASGLLSFVPGAGELAPGLATAMPTVSPDGLVYTFTLRSGLKFPDGTAFNAYDVKNSIERVIAHGGDVRLLVTDYVSKVETVGSYGVKFTLKEPFAFFPTLVAMAPYYPVSIGEGCFDYGGLNPNCTCGGIGPYTIVGWDHGVSIELEVNPDYYGPPPATSRIIVRYYGTSADLRQAVEDGDVDMAWRTLSTDDYQALALDPDIQASESDSGYIRYLAFNTITETPPFDNANIRSAIAAAVDREGIVHDVFTDSMSPLYSMVPQGMWSHVDSFFDLYGERDLTATVALLEAEGYTETNKLEFELWYPVDHYGSTEPEFAAAIEEDLEESGVISVTVKGEAWADFRDDFMAGQLPAFLLGWRADYMDPDNYSWPFGYSMQSQDMGIFYDNPAMDELLESGRETTPVRGGARQVIYQDIQELWAEEAPTIALLQGLNFAVVEKGVRGVHPAFFELLPYFTLYRSAGYLPLLMRNY
jgi:peptide/nickel transport system substrate-binding protein